MISQNQMSRLIEAREYGQLVNRILSNGRCRSAAAKRALTAHETAPAAGVGLALQRVCEITYRPSTLADSLARRLIAMQRNDGLFGSEHASTEGLLAGTAAALRGLMAFGAQLQSAGIALNLELTAAINQAMTALVRLYREGGDFESTAIGWAIVLWQLGDAPEFRNRIAVEQLLESLDDAGTDLVEDELCRYAHAMAA